MNHLVKKLSLIWAITLLLPGAALAQSNHSLRSPNQKIEVKIRLTDRVRYDVLVNGKALLQDATMALNIEQKMLGLNRK